MQVNPKISMTTFLFSKGLTAMEVEVAEFLMEGGTFKSISEKINISPHIVAKLARNVYRKTNCETKYKMMYEMKKELEQRNAN